MLLGQSQVRFVDESGGLESVVCSLSIEVVPGEGPQLCVDSGKLCIECGSVVRISDNYEAFEALVFRAGLQSTPLLLTADEPF
jgi:hypothetical protein